MAPVPTAATGSDLGLETVWTLAAMHEQRRDRDEINRARIPRDHADLQRATAEARAALEDAVVAAALAAERAITIVEALDAALAALNEPFTAASTATTPEKCREPADAETRATQAAVASLSPREREVLTLVAEGRSNKAIAEALYVSPNTVKTHVASLFTKLHAHTRVQLAAIAARQSPRSGDRAARHSPKWGMSAA
jgi:DNA-binding NarL/FixJ family response regulator